MGSLLQDIRFALRSFAKSPAFVLAAVGTLALGIGITTTMFSVVQGVLLEPLPYRDSAKLYSVWENHESKGGPREEWTGRWVFHHWRSLNQSFEGMAAFGGASADLTGPEGAESLVGMQVSNEYFSVLGVKPALGRAFLPTEETEGQNRVLVLSHGLFSRRFGADPALVGKSLTVNGLAYTVVGVLPEGFRAPILPNAALFSPLAIDPSADDTGNYSFQVIGRLKPGISAAAAQADMGRVASAVAAASPTYMKDVGTLIEPLRNVIVGPVEQPLVVLLGAVVLVLLIACANVANLLLTRATGRRQELAVRTALGASRGRLARQLLVESLLLALLGGGVGLLLGAWGLDLVRAFAPADTPRLDELAIDRTVLLFTLAVSLATGLLFGLAPVFNARRRSDVAHATGQRSTAGRQRLRGALVSLEIALGLALLVGAGLLLRTLGSLTRVDPGFSAERVATGTLGFPAARYPDPALGRQRLDEVLDRLAARPDVAAVGAVSVLPLSGNQVDISFGIEDRMPVEGEEKGADFRSATPGYFQALGIPLRAGRLFDATDITGSTPVAIVSEAFASTYFGQDDPIGRRMRIGNVHGEQSPWWTVVGVVGGVRDNRLDKAPDAEMYVPFSQRPSRRMVLVAKARTGDAAPLLAAIKDTVAAVDRDQPVGSLTTLEALVTESLATTRFTVGLLATFAGLALLLAAVGIYGVIAHAVSQRRREIGIRMAVGAEAGDIVQMVLRWGGGLVAVGIAGGLVAAFGLARALTRLLYGVSPADPTTFGVVALLLGTVAMAACYVPARRASKVDPVVTLKSE